VNSKIVSLEKIASISEDHRRKGLKLALTNGCFDLLHVGHVRYLHAARELGDGLVVAINGDDSVRALKGAGRPINREYDRAEVVAALAAVDYVVIFPDVRATKVITAVRPAIYVKGGDYKPETLDAEEREALRSVGAEIRIVRFETGYSTTDLLAHMKAE
jgi:rfaE bifunctional protein nucleotidyltransferase chain/domain